jgi:hypothetical protein
MDDAIKFVLNISPMEVYAVKPSPLSGVAMPSHSRRMSLEATHSGKQAYNG